MRKEREQKLNAIFFHHIAATCQKFFRGFHSRKHLHNYYGRKAYLEKVEKRGEWTNNFLQDQHRVQVAQAHAAEEEKQRVDFDNLASELHHLVSTKATPGVYNPPYNDLLPHAFEKPIEQHLRESSRVQVPKSLRQPKTMRRSSSQASPSGGRCLGGSHADWHASQAERTAGPPQDLPDRDPRVSRSASVGHLQKMQGPFRSKEQVEIANAKAHNNNRSIQAAALYDAVEQDRRMQNRLSKLTRVSPIDFMAPGFPGEKAPPSSVHIHVPFRERPVELRNDYCELPKIRDKPPFFTAMGGGKQFDDYHDAHLLPGGLV